MTDRIVFLIIAFFGIIGYLLTGTVDRFIARHITGSSKSGQESKADEYAESGD